MASETRDWLGPTSGGALALHTFKRQVRTAAQVLLGEFLKVERCEDGELHFHRLGILVRYF